MNAGPAARRIAVNTILRIAGELIAKLASLAFFVVMARELGKQGFGDFNFALALATLLLAPSGFGMDSLMAREVARDREQAHGYMSNVAAVKIVTALALLAIVVLIVNLGGYDEDAKLAVYLVGLGVAIENLGRTWHSTMQAYERLGLVSVSLIVQRIVAATAGIALMLGGAGLVTVSAVFLGGAVVGIVTAHLMLRSRVVRLRVRFDRARWLPLIRDAIPIGMVSLLFGTLLRLDATLVSFFTGGDNEEVGLYSAAFRLVAALFFLSWVFGQAAQPWLARQEEELPLARAYALGLKTLSAVLFPIGVGFAVLADPIIDLLYGAQFEGAVVPLRLLATVVALYGVNQFTSTLLIARYRPGEMRNNLIVVLVQNLVCNAILIPPLGADGAAISAAASALLLAVLSLLDGRRVTGNFGVARAFAGPLLASAAMAGLLLALDPPLPAAIVVGALVYAAALAGWERAVNPLDLRFILFSLDPRRRGGRALTS